MKIKDITPCNNCPYYVMATKECLLNQHDCIYKKEEKKNDRRREK